jgi:hypothetical protein
MLLFVNCSQDLFTPNLVSDADPVLLELAKDPSSEAVFATMAIQLETKGGFHKVLGLLNELVHDSKEQLHSMTKIWRGVHARCQISKIKLHGRQEFFETYLHQAERHVRQASQRLAEVKDHLKGYEKSQTVYGALLKSEITKHALVKKTLKTKFAHAQAGLDSLKKASAEVANWTPKGRALIQTHLMDVATSYLQVKEYELPNITEFLERTNDRKVKLRLTQWLKRVNAQLLAGASHFRNALNRLQKIGGQVEAALARMLVALKAGVAHLRKAITFSEHMIKAGKDGAALFGKLVHQNRGLIAANKKYCDNESVTYHKNQVQATAAIKLFREIRSFFVGHYSKIHSYIKAKYHID